MTEQLCGVCDQYESNSMHSIGDLRYHEFVPKVEVPTMAQILRRKYGLEQSPFVSHAKEREHNELARLFVQRFQQIRHAPADSFAGPQTFRLLDALTEGCPRCLAKPGEVHLRDCKA